MTDAQKIVLEDLVDINAQLSMIVEKTLMAQTVADKEDVLDRISKLSEIHKVICGRIVAL